MSRPKNSQWFDESKRLDLPPKKKTPKRLNSIRGARGIEMVRLGVNSKGQRVSVNRKYFDEMMAKHGEHALVLMME